MGANRRKPYPEIARERIDAAKLLKKLDDHADDAEATPMTSTQIKAAEILLRKVIPDLKAIEHSGSITTVYESMTDDQLNAQISARLQQIAQTVPALTHDADGDA